MRGHPCPQPQVPDRTVDRSQLPSRTSPAPIKSTPLNWATHLAALTSPDSIDGFGGSNSDHRGSAGDTVTPRRDNDGTHGHSLGCAGWRAVVGSWGGHWG